MTATICEVLPPDGTWLQTAPTPSCYTIEVNVPEIGGLNFGNICIIPGSNGFTPGFWSNKNGRSVLLANDEQWRVLLNGLNLVNADGTPFEVPLLPADIYAAHGALNKWLLNANATNMAYMLSVHLAANVLNSAYRGLDPNRVLILSQDVEDCIEAGSGVAGPYTIGQIQTFANASLGTDPVTNPGNPARDYQSCLKDVLDGLNNNEIPSPSPTPCPVNYPPPPPLG